MALTVNTNMSSMNALNNLNRTNRSLSGTFSHISSGLRINRAGDDAAGLGVAENLDAAHRSLEVAKRNTNDGIAVIQTAEGATSEVGNILKRMRELAVQSASETLHDDERTYIQDEYTELAGEVDRIASVTNFNGVALGDGSTATLDVQVGINDTANDRIQISMGDLRSATLGVDTGTLDLSTAATAQTALTGPRHRHRHGQRLPLRLRCGPEPPRERHGQPRDLRREREQRRVPDSRCRLRQGSGHDVQVPDHAAGRRGHPRPGQPDQPGAPSVSSAS